MNIAFYGKGGSGKTTLSVLYAAYLDDAGYRVGLLDVDVNSHTAEVIGAAQDDAKVLSLAANQRDIWRYLAGDNARVKPLEFLNTTPPGRGSNYWSLHPDNYLTQHYGQAFGRRSHVFTVGSYKADAIGRGCHHGTQSIAENLLSHARLAEDEVLLIDSVAGNDAFGTTLFLNDLLVWVVKPEREGVAVLRRFLDLAGQAGVLDRVVVIGNQITHRAQQQFLEREVPAGRLIGMLTANDSIIERRLANQPLGRESMRPEEITLFESITTHARQQALGLASRHRALIDLHRQVAGEAWVAGAYRAGLQDQIDPEYQP